MMPPEERTRQGNPPAGPVTAKVSAILTAAHRTVLACLAVLLLSIPIPLSAQGFTVDRTILPNGLVLLVREDRSLPFVTMQLLVDAGSRKDPQGKEGLARLTAKGLLLGSAARSSTRLNEELDFFGALLESSAGRDYATIGFKVLKKDLGPGFAIVMDALLNPVFPQKELDKEIRKTLGGIRSSEDDPGWVAERAFVKTLFDNHPYGHPVEGTPESMSAMKRDDVLNFYRTHVVPKGSVMVIVGDVTVEEVRREIGPLLLKWDRQAPPPEKPVQELKRIRKEVTVDRTLTQATIILGHRGISRDNPDYYAFSVLNYILGGGGLRSRLTDEIRNRRGLAYSVSSFLDPGRHPGSFQVTLQTKNASAKEAITIILEEMKKVKEEPVTDEELDRAKKYLVGSFPMRFDTQGKAANLLAAIEYYSLGLDYPARYPGIIMSLTKEQLLEAARRYLDPEEYIAVVVGNLTEAGIPASGEK